MHFYNYSIKELFKPAPPRRVISLVPSQTELLHYLGLDEEVSGITKFCVHPLEWFRTKERIGGTKNINIEKIIALRPDLVIANKEENVKEQVEALAEQVPVYVSDINDLDSAFEMITDMGILFKREPAAEGLIEGIRQEFSMLREHQPEKKLRCAYLIWKDPYMTVGSDTFIHNMLSRCGFINVFADHKRYPVIQIEEIIRRDCDIVLLSSEPYPFRNKHAAELNRVLHSAKILLADGEMFSWYGSRLLKAPAHFREIMQEALS